MTANKTFDRLVFVNRFFYPDISATSQLLTQLAFELAKRGHSVTVITGRSAYDNPSTIFPKHESVQGVDIIRISKNRFSRTNYAGRIADLTGFYIMLALALLKTVKRSDILICKTDPPMLIVLGALIKRIKKCRLICWNQDLFPEVAGGYLKRFPLVCVYPLLLKTRNKALLSCDRAIAISRAMKEKLMTLGAPRVTLIQNWSRSLGTDSAKIDSLKGRWKINNKFVVAYSGNFGLVHEYQTIKQVIGQLTENSKIIFLFIGSGLFYEQLRRHAESVGLANVIFKPYQPVEVLADSLAVADIHLITFKPEMEGLVFPSKFYGICSAARPVLFIGDSDSELAELIRSNRCGAVFNIGRAAQICSYLVRLSANSGELKQQSENARSLFERDYRFERAIEKWHKLLDSLTG